MLVSAWTQPSLRQEQSFSRPHRKVSSEIRAGSTFIDMCACYTAAITGWAQNVALALQVLLGALTTALGAALSGKDVRNI